MRLFIMEFKHLMFSKTFLFYCLLIIIFTVLNCQQVLKHPINSDVYQPQNMTMYSTDKNIIMSNEIKELKNEVHQNNFKTYQFGFLKIILIAYHMLLDGDLNILKIISHYLELRI